MKGWREFRRRFSSRRVVLFAGMAAILLLLILVVLAWQRSDLRSPEPTYLLRDRHGAFLGEVAAEPERGYGFWRLYDIPPRVAAATLAVEDRRFHRHPGVDPVAIARAMAQNVSSGERVSGASTLAMQVARLQDPGKRTYARKALEATTALFLTARHGRAEILRHYLRLVPYGHQIHGIAYAARRYLDKPVADLSWAEVAFLAAIPQAPSRMSPFDPRGRALAVRRGLLILDLLRDEGVLGDEQWLMASGQIHRLRIPPRARRPEEALHAVLRLERELISGMGQRVSAPIVDTTLDLELQREVQWQIASLLQGWRLKGAGNAALMVLDREGWQVRAAAGSAGWGDAEHAGSIDYLRVPRSSGSTLKPFFFARALDQGLIAPVSVLDDLERGAGGIVNSDGRFLGPLLPRFALGNSRNVPAADLLDRLGLGSGWSLLADLGLHDGRQPPERYGLGLTLGSLAVTLEDLATAYTALAGDGMMHEPRWLIDQESPWPVPAMSARIFSGRVFSEQAARQVALFLSDAQARLPSFPRMGHLEYPYAVAVKTGTSSRRRDAWTVAWSARYLVAAWVGHPDQRPMQGLTGYTSAALLVRKVMDRLHPELEQGMADTGFPPPRGHEAVKVCSLSGRRAGPACDRATAEWLPPAQAAALGPCTVHRHVAVDQATGLLADHRTPAERIEIRAVAGLPPRYAGWAMNAGLPLPPSTPRFGADPLAAAFAATVFAAMPSEPPKIRIVSPANGQHVLIDPETPASLSTLELRAEVDPGQGAEALGHRVQLLWTVDGEPLELVQHPEATRWRLLPGDHVFRAEIPSVGVRSRAVRVRVE